MVQEFEVYILEEKREEKVTFTHVCKMNSLSRIYSELGRLENDITGSGVIKIMTRFRKVTLEKAKNNELKSPEDLDVIIEFMENREKSFQNSEFVLTCVGIPDIRNRVINAMLRILEGSHLVRFMSLIDSEFDEEGEGLLISNGNDRAKSIYINRYQFSAESEADFLCNDSEKLVKQYLGLYTVDSANTTIVRNRGFLLDY